MKTSTTLEETELDMIPKGVWPGAFGIYKYSKRIVSFNLGAFLPLIIATYLVDIIGAYSTGTLLKTLLYILVFLFQLSSYVVLVGSFHKEKISASEALDKATRISLKVLAVYMIVAVVFILGLIALILPGLYLLPRLLLAPYYVIDKDMGIRESLEAAWHNSQGHAVITWGVLAVQILFGILALVIIGLYFSIVYSAAFIVLYGYVNSHAKP